MSFGVWPPLEARTTSLVPVFFSVFTGVLVCAFLSGIVGRRISL